MKKFVPLASSLLLVALVFSGCETPGESAAAGAATGAVIGGAAGRGPGAVFRGAAIGAGAGYLIGKLVQHERRERYYYDNEDPYYRSDERDYRHRYPVARSTSREGFVKSPYYPYNRIDVRGVPAGAQVIDPSNDRIFINP